MEPILFLFGGVTYLVGNVRSVVVREFFQNYSEREETNA